MIKGVKFRPIHRAPYVAREGKIVNAPKDEIWVGSGDNVQFVANNIVAFFRAEKGDYVALAGIGPASVNTALKAIAVAREKAKKHGFDLILQPYFSTIVDAKDEERTRIMMRVSCLHDTSSPA